MNENNHDDEELIAYKIVSKISMIHESYKSL